MGARLRITVGAVLVGAALCARGAADERIASMATLLSSRWPSRASWSADGRFVSFLSTDWASQNLFVARPDGGSPVALTHESGFVGGPSWDNGAPFGQWSPDSPRLLYDLHGSLRLANPIDGTSQPLTPEGSQDGGGRFSPDGQRVAFLRDRDLYVLELGGSDLRRLTRDADVVSGPLWSPDGRQLATTVREPAEHFAKGPAFLGPTLHLNWARRSPHHVMVVDVSSGAARRIGAPGGDETPIAWSPDGRRLLTEWRSDDFKTRVLRLRAMDPSGPTRTLYRQRDQRYVATNNQTAAFSPDGRMVLFTSDEDHWNHLYVVLAGQGSPVQLTHGSYEVSHASWSPDGRNISFVSTELGPEQPQVYRMPAAGGVAVRVTASDGVNTSPILAPVGHRVLFVHSDPHALPDLWVLDEDTTAPARRLTDSMSPALAADAWQAPRIVTYPAKDGLEIHAQLFLPKPFDRSRRYPAIVQVHEASAGNQDVFLGPGPQKDSVGWYLWHQRLAERGYVVLNVDYRGSFGYGRDFRTADYLVMGVDPLDDVVRGVDFLRSLGYVDASRVGVCGLSAGGRMVLSLLTRYPDAFRAGIDLAGIYDYLLPGGPWDERNPWVLSRLGTPESNAAGYRQASPKTEIARIRAPLLILHGTSDTNVAFTQSLALVDDLVALGKPFDFAVYPGEVHYFAHRASWVDAFRRMDDFLDRHLQSESQE